MLCYVVMLCYVILGYVMFFSSQDSTVDIVSPGYELENPGFDSRKGQHNIFCEAFMPLLRPTHPPIPWIQRALLRSCATGV